MTIGIGADLERVLYGMAEEAISEIPNGLSPTDRKIEVFEWFKIFAPQFGAGDEGPILDLVISHFGLSQSHRFEFSQLWRRATNSDIAKKSAQAFDESRISRKRKAKFVLPEKLLTSAPGLVGEIAKWITATAPKPQPALSLGAALTAVGVLKGHRVQTETGLRTNHFIIGLGASGSGKEHPRRMINLLFHQSGHQNLISGTPASDSGLFKLLKRGRGRALIQWDEIGHAMKGILSPYAPPHEKKIIAAMLSIWGAANGIFLGKEMADDRIERAELDQPCLCIWGTTVPGRFFESLTSDFVADGFLPRFLILEIADPDLELRDFPLVEDAPKHLVEALAQTKYIPTNVRAQGNLDAVSRIRPAIIEMDPFAKAFFADKRKEFDARKKDARGKGFDEVWNRAAEHVAKVALTVADGHRITESEVKWSADLVTRCLEASCEAYLEHVSGSNFERLSNTVISKIGNAPGITRGELLRAVKVPTQDLARVLDYLTQSEIAGAQTAQRRGPGRPPEKWYLLTQETTK